MHAFSRRLRAVVCAPARCMGRAIFLITWAAGPSLSATTDDVSDVAAARARDAGTLAAQIDHLVTARWQAERIEPSAAADDAEFLRRVYLDLTGRIPAVSEACEFLDDPAPDKRERLVDKLLAGPRYVTHFTNVWRALLLRDSSGNGELQFYVPGFEAWLRERIAENAGYDRMVREIITASFGDGEGDARQGEGNATPVAFLQANELKPENLAGSTARLFLGIKLECAQCHNHPFATWTRDQFWSYTAFFTGLGPQQRGGVLAVLQDLFSRQGLPIPGTDRMALPRFLDNSEPQWAAGRGVRATLADWITAPANPFFARAISNRMWAYFFGSGLVEPLDGFDDESLASDRKLLDELARQLVEHDFDLKFLIRAMTATRLYQLTSVAARPGDDALRLFARMPVRALTPEQLYDSLVQATGYADGFPANPRFAAFDTNSPRAMFLAQFANQNEKRTDGETSILQALTLMNGLISGDATNLERSRTLAAVADAPFLDTAGRIETLYLATLTRRPHDQEMERMVGYVASGGPTGDPKHALADVFWALLNSGEFMLTH